MEDDIQINLKKGTSIVNISYLDKDKELIVPVLTKISNAYQKYSKRDKDVASIKIDKIFFLGLKNAKVKVEKP